MEVFFNQDGAAPGVGSIAGNETTFAFPHGEWFEISQMIDLENDVLTLVVNGVEVFSDFAFAGNIGAINFFSTDASNRYYVDDVIFDGEPVSVVELSVDDFNVYPNPSNGIVNITSKVSLDQVVVSDVLGKEVLDVKISSQELTQIDLSETTKGIYLMTLFSDGNSISKKLIIE